MLVPQELLSCVVFLGTDDMNGKRLGATAFFVSVPILDDYRQIFLVTASHCVENKVGLFARLNISEGGTRDVALPDPHRWFYYPDCADEDHVEVAVLPWLPSDLTEPEATYSAGYRWVPRSMFFSEDMLSDSPIAGVGIGDDVIACGLLTVHSGQDKNATVVRSGNLAMIPDERVWVDTHNADMSLYLTELNVGGGMSGAPVFIRHRSMIGQEHVPVSLLGVWIGHWSEKDDKGARVHSAVGMVTPARLVARALDQDELMTERRKIALALGGQGE